ncbi:hypothetical protein FW778_15995 [Ginsengibacter hankyongi]|uniref:Transcriptional regulator LacI/GalR-like sensor domain-containing protein n=1 Tax=Ginsengibacter hankyongi TaxID=2607284 RepID=A0A5J5IEY9_9BACT|nr:hypothetical protein FW778_15995 [Ginsengibacter hankyongi]
MTQLVKLWRPTLSTVMLPCYEIGTTAVEMLIKRIDDRSTPPETITLQSTLIKRKSSQVNLK